MPGKCSTFIKELTRDNQKFAVKSASGRFDSAG